MVGQLHSVDLPPEVFARGFWLYAWKIIGPSGKRFCYIGMTGDVTGVAQSPFARAGGHFGSNKTVNQIRRYLEDPHGLKPEECQSFRFLFYGPLFPYEHRPRGQRKHPSFEENRKRVAALERRLIGEIQKSGYEILNRAVQPVRGTHDPLWESVRAAFATGIDFSS
jgi:hypothetical protein